MIFLILILFIFNVLGQIQNLALVPPRSIVINSTLMNSTTNACTFCTCYSRKDKFYVDCRNLGLTKLPYIPIETSRLLLDGNALTDIGYNNTFPQYLPNLRILQLNGNPISQISENAFENVRHIHTLLLHFTQITTIQKHLFSNLTLLKTLWLNDANIQTIDQEAFVGLTRLKELYLFGNSITKIPDGLFRNQHIIRHLYVDQNPLHDPSCCSLCGLPPPVDLKWGYAIVSYKINCGCGQVYNCSISNTESQNCYTDECANFLISSATYLSMSSRSILLLTFSLFTIFLLT